MKEIPYLHIEFACNQVYYFMITSMQCNEMKLEFNLNCLFCALAIENSVATNLTCAQFLTIEMWILSSRHTGEMLLLQRTTAKNILANNVNIQYKIITNRAYAFSKLYDEIVVTISERQSERECERENALQKRLKPVEYNHYGLHAAFQSSMRTCCAIHNSLNFRLCVVNTYVHFIFMK